MTENLSDIPLSFKFRRKVLSTLCKAHKSKKGLFLYIVCSFFMVIFLRSKIYPREIECPVNSIPHSQFESRLNSIIDTHLSKFQKKLASSDNSTDHWTEIAKDIFVYSAYIDQCPSDIISTPSFCVIFLGITFTNATTRSGYDLNCAIKNSYDVRNAGSVIIEVLPEDHFKEYSASFFYCSLEKEMNPSWPSHVTLFKSSITQWYHVKYLPFQDNAAIMPNLCVRPMYGSFSRIRMVEFLAYYSTMGVKHFIIYSQEISQTMQSFLSFLKSTSLSVELLPWKVPLSNDLIHEYGQIVFNQDCIIRSRYKFSHTIIVDLDEFIVPKLHSSITDLLFHLDHRYEIGGSYLFPMVLFCNEFSYGDRDSSAFSSLSPIKRQKTPWQYGFRSKYVARAERVRYGGVHFVWKHVKPFHDVNVPESVALLHHYRHCCGMTQTYFLHLFSFNVLDDEVVIDNSLIHFIPKVAHHSLVTYILHISNLTFNLSI